MSSKLFLLASLLLAIAFLISSEVSAKDLAKTSVDKKQVETTEQQKDKTGAAAKDQYGGGYPGGGYPGGGYGGGPGGGYGGYPGGGYGGRGRGCYYGCCRRSYYGRGCSRCCSYAGQAVDKLPHN